MSQNAALFTLVRVNPMADTIPDHEYTAGDYDWMHDEIELVDLDGTPCAIPSPLSFDNKDYEYNYITGDRGRQARQIGRDITLAVDLLDPEVLAKLEHWMQQRALVYLSPGFGRSSILAWRPFRMYQGYFANGDAAYDLTGNYPLIHGNSDNLLKWDPRTKGFLKNDGTGDTIAFYRTPYGAAFSSHHQMSQRMNPPQPESATWGTGAGTSGWSRWGTDASQITATYHTDAGHTDFTNYIRVTTTAAASSSRAIGIQSLWPVGTFTGPGPARCVLFVRGRATDYCQLLFNQVGTSGTTCTIDISGQVFDTWTPLVAETYSDNWTVEQPSLQLALRSSNAEPPLLDVGAIMVMQQSSYSPHAGPYWVDGTGAGSYEFLSTNSSYPGYTPYGTYHFSFWLDDDALDENGGGSKSIHAAVLGNFGNPSIELIWNNSAQGWVLRLRDISTYVDLDINTVPAAAGKDIRAGQMNTLCVTWDADGIKSYVNGVLTDSYDGSGVTTPLNGTGDVSIASVGVGNIGCAPLKVTGVRIDRGVWDANKVMNEHLAIVDPIASAIIRAARARVYVIESIPTTARLGYGPSHILGNIRLKQVDYHHRYADPFNEEGSLP